MEVESNCWLTDLTAEEDASNDVLVRIFEDLISIEGVRAAA